MVVVMFVRLYMMEVEDCEEIDILPAVLCILYVIKLQISILPCSSKINVIFQMITL